MTTGWDVITCGLLICPLDQEALRVPLPAHLLVGVVRVTVVITETMSTLNMLFVNFLTFRQIHSTP